MAIKASSGLKDFIRSKESFKATPYEDVTGKMTVGYGDTAGGMITISEEEANQRLADRLVESENAVNKFVTRKDLTQEQQDVLLDMEYNIGITKLRRQGFIDLVNNGNQDEIGRAILNFSKAKDKKTGMMKEFPGLKKRSEERAKLWGYTGHTTSVPTGMEKAPSDPLSDFSSFQPSTNPLGDFKEYKPKETNPFSDFKAYQPQGKIPVDPVKARSTDLSITGQAFDATEVKSKKEAKKLAKEENIPVSEAEALIFEKTPNQVRLERNQDSMSKYFPVATEWAKSMDNYALLRDNTKTVTKIETASKAVNPSFLGDMAIALKSGAYSVQEAYSTTATVLAGMNPKTLQKTLRELDAAKEQNSLEKYKNEEDKLSASFSKVINALGGTGASAGKLWDDIFNNGGSTASDLKAVFDGSVESANSILGTILTAAENPEALAIMGARTTGAIAAPVAGLFAGAAVGSFAGPVGTLVGARAGNFAASSLLSFGTYMRDQLEEFRDPSGVLLVEEAFSDPDRVSKWTAQAAAYGLTMGAIDTIFTGMAGNSLVKPVQGNSFLKKAISKSGALAKGTAVQAVGEGLGETGATIAAAAVGGELTAKGVGEAIGKGVTEGIASIVPGAAMDIGGAGVRRAKDWSISAKESIAKTADKVKKSNSANGAYNSLQTIREHIEADSSILENPEAIADLINRASKGLEEGKISQEPFEDSALNSAIDAEVRDIQDEARKGIVSIYPSEWNSFAGNAGLDPADSIRGLGLQVAQAYIANKETDSSIEIPIGDWVIGTKDIPEADAIARVNGNEYNAIEGGKIVEDLEKDPFTYFDQSAFYQRDKEQPPVIPGQEGEEFIPPVGDFSGEPVLRPVELFDRFRNDTEKKTYRSILSQLRDSTAWAKGVPKESLDIVAELQFRHTKARAEMLGKTIDEVANMAAIGMTSKAGTRGLFGRQATFWQPYRIAFNRTADAATIVHELGHSWLHEMSEDWTFISNMPEETLTTQQREYRDVMEIAAKELGIGTMDRLYDRSKDEVTHIHEIFSQTTEKYFLEGKFADSRVKKMLDFFRQWMTKIAHIVGKTYPEHPGLEITPQVERIFNALLDADNKVKEELYPMFAEPMFPEGFLGKADQEKYLDTIQDARSEAIAELYGRMMKAPLKEREAMINKALDEFTKEAEEDVAKLPSMRLLRDMETYYAQYKKKELDKDPRISFESFKKLLAEDRDTKAIELRATLPEKMISTKGKGGVDIEIVMQQMGITDPNEMLNILKQAGQKEQLINDRVNELIDKNFPPLKTDKEIHDIAVESLNKLGKEKILQKEFNILLDKYRPQIKVLIEKGMLPAGLLGSKDAKKIMQAKADQILLDSAVGGFNIARFLTDSDRHGRQAAKSFKEGNVVHSFEEKYKQSIQFYAYKKAIGLLRPIAETKVLSNTFEKIAMDPKKAKTYDIDVMTYGVQIINMFRNGLTSLPPLDISAFSDRSGISEDHVELINKQLQDMAISANGRGGRTTSVRTYLEFGAVLKSLINVARDAKKVEIGGEVMNREQFINKLLSEVGPRLAKDMPITEREAVQSILMGLRPVRSELASLFPTDADFEKSALGQIYNDITKAEAIRNEKLDVQRSKIVNAVKEATKTDSTLAAIVKPLTNIVGSTILNNPPTPVRMNNLGITLDNKAELYMFLLYLGSESGSEKLLRGGVKGSGPLAGYNIETNELDMSGVQADIDGLIADGTLTKKDFDMLQTVWDAFDAFHPDAAKAIRATDGRNLGYVKGKTVKTPWGDYRGGYIPITSDTYLKQQSLESMRSPDNAMYKSNDFYPSMDMTFTNTRDRRYYDVNLDFSRITAKLAGTANVAYLREPLMNIGKVLGSPQIMNAIENRRPGFYEASLIPWFDRTKLQQYSEPSREFHNKFAKMLRSNANLKFYFGNVLSGVKQYIGLTNAIPLVGAGNLSFAAGRFVTAPKANINFISSLDPRMKQMFESHHINQIKSFENLELNFDWLDTSKEKLNQMAFFVIQSMQSHVSAIVWMAGYDKALKEGLTERQAINFATNSVKNSQGSTTVSDMAKVQFGPDAWKLFTMFSMVPITGGSELYKSYMRAGDTPSGTTRASLRFAAVMGAGVFTFMAPTILEAIVSEFGKGEKEDEEKKRKALLKDMAFNFADQAVPVYGRWIAKPLIYGQVSVSPLVDNVTQDFGAAKRGVDVAGKGAEITAREFSGMMNMLTYGSGLPFTILGKAVKMDEKSMGKKEATRKAKRRKIVLKKAKVAEKKRTRQ